MTLQTGRFLCLGMHPGMHRLSAIVSPVYDHDAAEWVLPDEE